jgi:uncharacterized membrane protein
MSERQDKKAQFEQDKKRSPLPRILLALVVVAATVLGGWLVLGKGDGKYPTVSAHQGVVTLPVSQIADGKAHFFSYKNGDTAIDFFVLKSRDGVIRAAFDTCDVCYKAKKGYRQEGDFMVCNNCDQTFASDKINEIKGGCNPAPLQRRVEGGNLLIAEAGLKQGAWNFKVE